MATNQTRPSGAFQAQNAHNLHGTTFAEGPVRECSGIGFSKRGTESCRRCQDFLLTSPWFGVSLRPRRIHFAYYINGETETGSEGTLSLQAWDLEAGWLQIWQRSGHGALQWRFGVAIVPENAAALRIIASSASSSGVISLDEISTSIISPSYKILTCSFEADTCGWTASDAQARVAKKPVATFQQKRTVSGGLEAQIRL